jgi:hypothetical protein
MRVSFVFLAAFVVTIAAPGSAQSLGGLGRSLSGAVARDVVKEANRPKAAQPAASAPHVAAPAGDAPTDGAAAAGGAIVVAEDMPVISSDGARVAVVKHTTTGGTTYALDKTFFTADPYYRLRRIYGWEATVRGGAVHLMMTAAQYRARNQNPE